MYAIMALLAISVGHLPQVQGKATPPAIGAMVPDFAVPDTTGRIHSLKGYKDKKAVVIVFVGTECPIANLYLPTLAELHKRYCEKGIGFLAINSNAQDSLAEVVAHAQERKLPFPVLKDAKHQAADAIGATRTPEAFLLDSARIIRYRGRIDDQYGYNYRKELPTQMDLREAIDQLLAGKPITKAETEVRGCVIGRDKRERSHNQAR